MDRRDRFHPAIYKIMAGLAVLVVLSAWSFIGPGYAGISIAVVSLFILVAVALPFVLRRIRRHNAPRQDAEAEGAEPFGAWLARKVDSGEGHITGAGAATSALLPIVAVALGMVVFAIVHGLSV